MVKNIIRYLFPAAILAMSCISTGCGKGQHATETQQDTIYSPSYAKGFIITGIGEGESTIIKTLSPWQDDGKGQTTELLIKRNGETIPEGYNGQVLDINAVNGKIKVVAMSSSHIAMLDAIGRISNTVGVSGMGFISTPYIRSHGDAIGDVGYDGNIDYELLLSLSPDLVLLYGVDGANIMEKKLKELGIPFMYVGDYLEDSPLGKAEWMVAVAEATGGMDDGIDRFTSIPDRYNAIKERVDNSEEEWPTIMINTPYGDSWVMASQNSYVATLIADAGGHYIYGNGQDSNRSVPIDIEEAYMLASGSNIWINTGTIASMEGLRQVCPKFMDTPPVKSGQVYNTTLRTTDGGGNDYWESGIVNPDLVLADMVKIFHPSLADDIEFTYYKRLE